MDRYVHMVTPEIASKHGHLDDKFSFMTDTFMLPNFGLNSEVMVEQLAKMGLLKVANGFVCNAEEALFALSMTVYWGGTDTRKEEKMNIHRSIGLAYNATADDPKPYWGCSNTDAAHGEHNYDTVATMCHMKKGEGFYPVAWASRVAAIGQMHLHIWKLL